LINFCSRSERPQKLQASAAAISCLSQNQKIDDDDAVNNLCNQSSLAFCLLLPISS